MQYLNFIQKKTISPHILGLLAVSRSPPPLNLGIENEVFSFRHLNPVFFSPTNASCSVGAIRDA
jgi:hypothetical protein